jgi:DnaJ-class molecular chaperone
MTQLTRYVAYETRECSTCNGKGEVAPWGFPVVPIEPCWDCNATGQMILWTTARTIIFDGQAWQEAEKKEDST